jgi:hypothetical protein
MVAHQHPIFSLEAWKYAINWEKVQKNIGYKIFILPSQVFSEGFGPTA